MFGGTRADQVWDSISNYISASEKEIAFLLYGHHLDSFSCTSWLLLLPITVLNKTRLSCTEVILLHKFTLKMQGDGQKQQREQHEFYLSHQASMLLQSWRKAMVFLIFMPWQQCSFSFQTFHTGNPQFMTGLLVTVQSYKRPWKKYLQPCSKVPVAAVPVR